MPPRLGYLLVQSGDFALQGAEDGISADHSRFAIEVAERSVTMAESLRDPDVASEKGYEFDNYDAWLAERLDTLAWIHFRLGDQADPARIERALTLAERCVALDPENTEYQGRVAMYKARM